MTSAGPLDPSGLVKGWAIERASQLLHTHGAHHHAVNGGGDVRLSGEAGPGRPWRIGIADPLDRTRIACVVSGTDLAVATSGTAERGAHIVDPVSGAALTALGSTTVVGPSMTYADAYATAAFVMGDEALQWMEELEGYETMLIGDDGQMRFSSGWEQVTAGMRATGRPTSYVARRTG